MLMWQNNQGSQHFAISIVDKLYLPQQYKYMQNTIILLW